MLCHIQIQFTIIQDNKKLQMYISGKLEPFNAWDVLLRKNYLTDESSNQFSDEWLNDQ